MAKHLIDLDEDTLQAARTELGTVTIKETVNEGVAAGDVPARPADGCSPRRAGRSRPCRPRGSVGEALDVTVLHYDSDSDLIASVTGQRCSWVVAAGSVE